MDISGPIRAALRSFVAQEPPTDAPEGPLELLVRMAVYPDYSPASVPHYISEVTPSVPSPGAQRAVHDYFTLAAMMRILPRLKRPIRDQFFGGLQGRVSGLIESAQKLLIARPVKPVGILWHHWLLALARKRLSLAVPDALLLALWQRGFAGQSKEGQLHPLAPEMALDSFVYDELCALHAAYNTILFLRDYDSVPRIEKIIQWHVAHTQPDHATTEPWGLAAFAALDDTQTFAPQQMHDALTRLSTQKENGMTLALLADALMSQEDAATA